MKNVLRKIGRFVFWMFIVVVLLRGVIGIFSGPTTTSPANEASNSPVFPQQQEAEAFAESFTTKYLTYKSGGEEAYIASLEGYHSLSDNDAGFTVPETGVDQQVAHVVVSRFDELAKDRARIVVRANAIQTRVKKGKKGKPDKTQVVSNTDQYWTVHVARDDEGGLTVYQHPSRVAAPPSTTVEVQNMEQPEPSEESDFELLLTYFFPAYFSGDSEELKAYIPTNTHMEAIPADQLEFVSVDEIQQPEGSTGNRRSLTVEVGVATPAEAAAAKEADQAPVASRTMTYDVEVQRTADNRWLVSAINP